MFKPPTARDDFIGQCDSGAATSGPSSRVPPLEPRQSPCLSSFPRLAGNNSLCRAPLETVLLSCQPVHIEHLHFSTMFRPICRSGARQLAARARRPIVSRTFASAAKSGSCGPVFNWEDPLASNNLLTEEELAIAETAERYCQERMLPRVLRMVAPSWSSTL